MFVRCRVQFSSVQVSFIFKSDWGPDPQNALTHLPILEPIPVSWFIFSFSFFLGWCFFVTFFNPLLWRHLTVGCGLLPSCISIGADRLYQCDAFERFVSCIWTTLTSEGSARRLAVRKMSEDNIQLELMKQLEELNQLSMVVRTSSFTEGVSKDLCVWMWVLIVGKPHICT